MAGEDAPIVDFSSVVTSLQQTTQAINLLNQTISSILPRVTGTFTMAAAATLVVPQSAVAADSFIALMPTNASAGVLMGSNESLYISARTAGVSFTVATGAGTSAAGTETFTYFVFNPA